MSRKRIIDAFVAFVLALALNYITAFVLGGRVGIFVLAISSVMLIIPACFLIRRRNEDPMERLSLHLPTIKSFFAAVFVYAGANSVASGIIYALYSVYYKNIDSPDAAVFDTLSEMASPMLILLCIAIIPAIAEEMLFRGYIQTAFTDTKRGAILAISISSVLFCIAHGSIYKASSTLILGIAFGYIAYRSGSILITVILHFLNNATSLISYYSLKNVSDEMMSFVFKDSSYYYIAVISLTAGAFLIFVGVRLFSEKKLRLAYKIIPTLLAVLVAGGALFGTVMNETDVILQDYSNAPVENAQIIEKKLVLKKNTMCIVEGVFNYGEGVECDFKIYDGEQKEVYDGSEMSANALMLDKGNYTVRLEFSVEEDVQSSDVAYSIMIMSFGEYETVGS